MTTSSPTGSPAPTTPTGSDLQRTSGRHPKVECTMVSTPAASVTPSATMRAASVNRAYCSRLRDEPGDIADNDPRLADLMDDAPSFVGSPIGAARVGNQFHAGDERCRIREVHAEEARRVSTASARGVMLMVEVFVAMRASSGAGTAPALRTWRIPRSAAAISLPCSRSPRLRRPVSSARPNP
jgi:hypothetical protein